MNNIELSFCIPTYNRAESVNRLVTSILSCRDPAIEVVVLDNGSTDDTLNILRAIKDDRLFVYSNGENKGALFNMVNVLDKGTGKFLVYSTDQDHVDNIQICGFKTFLLKHANLAGGFCEFNSESNTDYEIFPQGYQAVKKIAYQGRHPTGYFFNRELLKSIKLIERFSDYDFVDLFPLEFAFAELCLMGDGAVYHRSIFAPETGALVVKHKSSTTDGKSKKAFFAPDARLKLAINYTKHISTLPLALQERRALIIDTFVHELVAATIGYRAVIKNIDLCTHYYMERRDINIKELLNIGFYFYKQYRRNIMPLWDGNLLTQISFEFYIFLKLITKTLRYIVLKLGKWQRAVV